MYWITERLIRFTTKPIALCLAIGTLCAGIWSLIWPSPASSFLPKWIDVIWTLYFVLGGALATYGQFFYKRGVERAGWALIGSALIISVVLTVGHLHTFSGGVILTLALAIGCSMRAFV